MQTSAQGACLAATAAALLVAACCLASGGSGSGDPQPRADRRLLVMTSLGPSQAGGSMAGLPDEAFERFNRSLEAYGLRSILLRPTGGRSPAGSEAVAEVAPGADEAPRVAALKEALASYKDDRELVVLVVDSGWTVVNGDERDILDRFAGRAKIDSSQTSAGILFATDHKSRPERKEEEQEGASAQLDARYAAAQARPQTSGVAAPSYLSSRAFMGPARAVWELLQSRHFPEPFVASSWQRALVEAYLDEELRKRLGLELDLKSEVFQSLRGPAETGAEAVELELEPDGANLKNVAHASRPLVVLANDAEGKVQLNALGNYLAKAWTPNGGCRHCNESRRSLAATKPQDMPLVLIGLFVEEATPFLADFFESVRQLNYPSDRVHLLVHNAVEQHQPLVRRFLEAHGSQYAGHQLIGPQEGLLEWQARNEALRRCRQLHCDHFLSLDSVARLELADTLRLLIETNRTLVAPLLARPHKMWSNFWGALTGGGFYARSRDYVELVRRERRGLWNVAHVMNAYLLDGRLIRAAERGPSSSPSSPSSASSPTTASTLYHDNREPSKPVLTFSRQMRAAGHFQWLLNTHHFGHLVDATGYNATEKHADFRQLINNRLDWERHYLHENYTHHVDPAELDLDELEEVRRFEEAADQEEGGRPEQPCPDVIWFPLVSELFCRQLIEIMEHHGQWSGGHNEDPRIEGGYESVPTRDIHMRQVGLHEMWLVFLRLYVMPVQAAEFIGYEHDPPRSELAFVVRYHPQEQASLKPHHDSSTYTLNIALNEPGRDYTGGGCRFVRYNCSVTDSRLGWGLLHPGRLTHYHEGLPVTSGTRYIMVTFVDP